jgi:hypothetical protein
VKYKQSKIIIYSATILLLVPMCMTSCEHYKTFTNDIPIARCSFEYNSSFPTPYLDNTINEKTELISYQLSKDNKPTVEIGLVITVMKSNSDYIDYQTFLEKDLALAQQGLNENEFKLIERSQIMISGIHGEQVNYYYNPPSDSQKSKDSIYPKFYEYKAYFENNGFLWSIEVYALAGNESQAKEYYHQITRTFELLP